MSKISFYSWIGGITVLNLSLLISTAFGGRRRNYVCDSYAQERGLDTFGNEMCGGRRLSALRGDYEFDIKELEIYQIL